MHRVPTDVTSRLARFGFGFDDEQGVGFAAAGGAEFFAGGVEGCGVHGEDHFAVVTANELEAALLSDEL